MTDARDLSSTLRQLLGGNWLCRATQASGFCATWVARQGTARLFIKSTAAQRGAMLEAEADGLAAILATGAIRVPRVIGQGTLGPIHVLCLEWLELASPEAAFGARLGAALAQLHCAPHPGTGYGWGRSNFIGATPQPNACSADWPEFFRTQRLAAMRDRLPPRNDALRQAVDAVCEALPRFFDDGHVPHPSLIHGDLWQGNWGMLVDGTPVIYDPAVSCSDAEAELAMMELFGAPPAGFWPAYRARAGLHPGYARRRQLYQLYHLLNHAVLFGEAYARQALQCARALARA